MSTRHFSTTTRPLRPVWAPAFIAALRETGIVRAACAAARIDRTTPYVLRKRDPKFRAAWEEAIEDAADLLELEANRRAKFGVKELVIYEGKVSHVWVNGAGDVVAAGAPGARRVPLTLTRYSDALLIVLLAAARPDKFRA